MPNVNISGRDATELYTAFDALGVLDNVSNTHVRISNSFGYTEAKVDWGAFYPPAAGIRVKCCMLSWLVI